MLVPPLFFQQGSIAHQIMGALCVLQRRFVHIRTQDQHHHRIHEASGEEHSEDRSDEATDHHSRSSIFKAGRNVPGKSLPRRRRGIPDAQPCVQPQNATVATKCVEASN